MGFIDDTSLDLRSLMQRYRTGETTPDALVRQIYERIEQYADPAVWIYLAPIADSLNCARALMEQDPSQLPLYGVPFAIKDNLDWAGVPTTAGCPEFAYVPERSATVLEQLCGAGAIPIGKTNLDQFATGLVGTRTPYGVCRNPFDARYLPGGSSAGSGVAVAAGLVSFSLGTDTAGSGRVPAAFTNIVGLKPTRGLISTKGLVPAVRSLDCVSVFALTCADAEFVLQIAGGFDADDPFSRLAEPRDMPKIAGLRVGVPSDEYLNFFGNINAEQRYREAITHLETIGCQIVAIDFQPFAETVPLLYEGPWLAERYAAVGKFLEQHPHAVHPTVGQIISSASRYDAVSVYQGMYRLAELKRQSEAQWRSMDILALPTTGTIYTVAEVVAEPTVLNRNLGTYTNFVNLLDLCALAVPSGLQSNGLPTGLTLIAPMWQEALLCQLGAAFHTQLGGTLGATGIPLATISASTTPLPVNAPFEKPIRIAVVGAHLTGQPLNHQLIEEQGTLVRSCRTSSIYRLYALTGTTISKPGLIRQSNGQGYAIEVEVWELPVAGFGRFVAKIPPPLGIGTLVLEDGEEVKGFLCESYAIADAPDISHLGGWRAYLASLSL
ncbi:MAG: allophanate hydrolase [Chroococcidiopsidaceae cyanobacterium CP_BM_ER_R8_30]|nr:allophanate hydrolase [Chroococcidiopsidaceae cyanobacterium CP_BM_ER_R8_30]